MLECFFSRYPLISVIRQQFFEYIQRITGSIWRKEFLQPHSLLGREVELHMCCMAFKAVEDLLLGCSEDMVDEVHLVELIPSRKKGLFLEQFEENATETPDVHLLIVVAVGHETLGRAIPPSGYIFCVGLLTVPA